MNDSVAGRCPVGTAVPVNILVIEEDPADEGSIRDAFAEYRLSNRLTLIHDCGEALALLRRRGFHAGAPRPDLILLDLKLRHCDALAVIDAIRENPELAHVPVVLLGDSLAEEEMLPHMGLRVDAYASKPVDFTCLVGIVRSVAGLGISVVKLQDTGTS